jgi:hypothetical protein
MASLTLTPKTVLPYLRNILDWELNVPSWFWNLSTAEIAECYNGVGSDLTAKPLRAGLTHVYDFALEAVIIHDTIWSKKEKFNLSLDDFYASNENLKINARICLKYKYSWWNPYYIWCYGKAWLAQDACNNFGKEAWES